MEDCLSRADQQYKCMAEIGEGAYWKVFKAPYLKNGGRFVALKRMQVQTGEEGMPLSTIREVAVLRHVETLEHPEVVRSVFFGNMADLRCGAIKYKMSSEYLFTLEGKEHINKHLDVALKRHLLDKTGQLFTKLHQ